MDLMTSITICWTLLLSRKHTRHVALPSRLCIVFAICRQELKQLIGSIEDAAVPTAAETARSLATFSCSAKSSIGGKDRTEVEAEHPEPFGTGIDFRQPKVFGSADEAVLAMCDALPGSATAAQSRWDYIPSSSALVVRKVCTLLP